MAMWRKAQVIRRSSALTQKSTENHGFEHGTSISVGSPLLNPLAREGAAPKICLFWIPSPKQWPGKTESGLALTPEITKALARSSQFPMNRKMHSRKLKKNKKHLSSSEFMCREHICFQWPCFSNLFKWKWTWFQMATQSWWQSDVLFYCLQLVTSEKNIQIVPLRIGLCYTST